MIKAFKLYIEAAEKGQINAICHLGYNYQNGIGIERNEIKAFELYKKAAKKGQIDAIYKLRHYFQYGIETKKIVFIPLIRYLFVWLLNY
jgi:TPR repeat protein